MTLYNVIFGAVRVSIITASPEQLITKLNDSGVVIYEIFRESDIKFSVTVKKKDFSKLTKFVESRGEKIEIDRKLGLWWKFTRIKQRPVLIFTFIFILFLSIFLPTRILFIKVEGNNSLSNACILESAAKCGISFGTVRKNIRSEQFKNKMLELIPQLQWTGINTKGCVATISVQERQIESGGEVVKSGNCIVAARDGIISSVTVTRGTPLCVNGDEVKAGQILITGYTDLGNSLRFEEPDGEIYANTEHQLTALTPSDHLIRLEETEIREKYSILIGKKLINLFKGSGISGISCDRIYKKYDLKIPGGFSLPISLIRYTETSRRMTTKTYSDIEHFTWMQSYIEKYLQSQMIAGSIDGVSWADQTNNDFYRYTAHYRCTEMIGTKSYKEFTEEYGKRN